MMTLETFLIKYVYNNAGLYLADRYFAETYTTNQTGQYLKKVPK